MSRSRDPSDRRRRAVIASSAVVLVVGAGIVTAASEHAAALRAVDIVKIAALIVLALVVALRATTSFRLAKRNPALDDELTRANRASAARSGYWALMIGTVAAFVASMFAPLEVAEIMPLLLAMGAAGAGIRFAILEARGDA